MWPGGVAVETYIDNVPIQSARVERDLGDIPIQPDDTLWLSWFSVVHWCGMVQVDVLIQQAGLFFFLI